MGCKRSKHICKEEEDEDVEEIQDEKEALKLKKTLCTSCRQYGHKHEVCFKDPNIRLTNINGINSEMERISKIPSIKKPNLYSNQITANMFEKTIKDVNTQESAFHTESLLVNEYKFQSYMSIFEKAVVPSPVEEKNEDEVKTKQQELSTVNEEFVDQLKAREKENIMGEVMGAKENLHDIKESQDFNCKLILYFKHHQINANKVSSKASASKYSTTKSKSQREAQQAKQESTQNEKTSGAETDSGVKGSNKLNDIIPPTLKEKAKKGSDRGSIDSRDNLDDVVPDFQSSEIDAHKTNVSDISKGGINLTEQSLFS
jgi:hypothetical protein